MKKRYLLMLFSFIFFTSTISAQEKCMCKLVKGYTKDAGKLYPGESLETVPFGQELWIRMSPAHFRNTGENGGCRLQAGEVYVADEDGNPIRAYDCGNAIVAYKFYPTSSHTTTISSTPNELNVTVNVNTNNDKDLQRGYDNRIGGLDDDRILVSDEYARMNFPQYDRIITNPEVKKRGKWWIVPVAILAAVGTYAILDGVIDGEWGEWFDHPFTKTTKVIVYYDPNDPNNPNYDPNHNPNERDWGGGIENRGFTNIALDASSQFAIGPPRGIVFGIGF